MLIDAKSDVAYILLNAEDSNKHRNGSHQATAERFDIDYFIRSGNVTINTLTDESLPDHLTPTTILTRKVTRREEDRIWS